MGCINSKKDLSELKPNIYRVVNVDSDGVALWTGHLEITPKELILYRKSKDPTKWSLQHLRRYGFDADVFTFEAGRRCTTGEGIYAFKCRRAESLFHTLQAYIQGTALNEDGLPQQLGDLSTGSIGQFGMGQARGGRQGQNSRPNSLTQNPNPNTNYVIPNSRTQSLSPNGTIHSSNPSRSTDTLTGDGNYLEPTPLRSNLGTRYSSGMRLGSVSSGPLSPEPNSPGSPNSFTNIHEVTHLNQQHQQPYQNSNLYQEFPLRSSESNNNNLLNKKLSLDIPPAEPAPPLSSTQQQQQQQLAGNLPPAEETHVSPQHPHQTGMVMSPTTADEDASHMYVNVTPGEIDSLVNTPTAVTTSQMNFGFGRLSSSYSVDPSTRCYENLEPGEFRPLLTRSRYSKPDIFAKVDLPPINQSGNSGASAIVAKLDKSEPSTPTIKQNRKVNYIVLDLDQSPSASSLTATNSLTASTTGTNLAAATNGVLANSSGAAISKLSTNSQGGITAAMNTSLSHNSFNNNISNNHINNNNNNSIAVKATTPTISASAMAGNTLLPPESPKKASLGYATIDFNRTVALSNTTAPSPEVDSEGSRKTRHSSTAARHSNSISD